MAVKTVDLTGGTCLKDDNYRQLFSSQYVAPFDAESFLEDHPEIAPPAEKDDEGNVLPREGSLPLQVQLAATEHMAKYAVMTEHAKAICAECPVRQLCLQFALESEEAIYGVVGGMTEYERYQYRLNNGEEKQDIPLSSPSVAKSHEDPELAKLQASLAAELGQ